MLDFSEWRSADTCSHWDILDLFFSGFEELTCYCGESVIYPPVPCGTQPPECKKTCTRPHDCDHPGKSGNSVLLVFGVGFCCFLVFLNENVEKCAQVCLQKYLLFY